jgi:hypothetical protein
MVWEKVKFSVFFGVISLHRAKKLSEKWDFYYPLRATWFCSAVTLRSSGHEGAPLDEEVLIRSADASWPLFHGESVCPEQPAGVVLNK